VTAFPTAPGPYRRLLQVETAVFDLPFVRRRLRQADGDRVEGGPSNHRRNRLGNLVPERVVPGEVADRTVAQHVARYSWAMDRCAGRRVVELGCGSGYGTNLLSWVAAEVVGIDLDAEAVRRARAEYPGARFEAGDITDEASVPAGDVGVCFEVLEHVSEPERVLRTALRRFPRLLLSFPNPLLNGSHLNPHHRNDWPLRTLRRELARAGARQVSTYHQRRHDSLVRRGGFAWNPIWVLDVRR
jgi:SAM-dependent methyltransferase